MKTITDLYVSFNVWAHRKITDTVLQLEEMQIKQELKSSFPTIHATMIHMFNAETIWMNRIRKTSDPDIAVTDLSDSSAEIIRLLLAKSEDWEKFVHGKKEEELYEMITYKNIRGEQFTQALYEIIHHIVNYSTYHRGQLITMMRTLGKGNMPKTDLIDFAKERQKAVDGRQKEQPVGSQ